jgi:hypothetical protein
MASGQKRKLDVGDAGCAPASAARLATHRFAHTHGCLVILRLALCPNAATLTEVRSACGVADTPPRLSPVRERSGPAVRNGINPYSGKPYSKRYYEILETRKKLPVRPARLPPRPRPSAVAGTCEWGVGSG